MSRGRDHIKFVELGRKMILLLFFLYTSHAPSAQPSRADQVKAAFLYNFTQFVDWPANAFTGNTFVIGILGNDPFGDYLEALVKNEKVNGRSIVVQRYSGVGEIKNCQLLFINNGNSTAAIKALAKKNILTVGDDINFAREGGMIRFFIENNKIRLQINLTAAREAGLSISSKLLRVSEVIENE